MTGKRAKLRLTVTPNYLHQGNTHLEIRSATRDAPHPLSQTGYRSHFIDAGELSREGGAVAFVSAWIAREAKGAAFLREDAKRRQGNLFDWAEARAAAIAPTKPARRPQGNPAARPRRAPQRRPG